ncbi:FGGY family carbohydrate kinase [Fodinibacter luteus]|uniref:FGGY family carbohydrate kinase n=1 Tax=Fodinibacter luteus TaxID=552064 RepID=A0ABP8JZH4_9MICO
MRHPLVVDLGFDLGTTVTKLTALAEDGSKLVDLSVATTWHELADGRAERDPQVVVDAVEDLVARAATTIGAGNGAGRPVTIRSIGFTSMAEAGVLVDADGRAHSPVIAWFDPRGAEQARALPADLAHDFPARTGLPVSHVASLFKLAWLRDQGLSLAGLQWLSLPEFVIDRLGGRRVAELSLMGRTGFYDIHADGLYRPALDHLGVGEDFVPELVGAGTPAGRVRADHPVVAVRGAVLTVAGHDHAVAAAAANSAATASAMDSFGTAEAFLVASAHVPDPERVRTLSAHGVSVYPHVVRGTTGLLAGMRTGLVLKRVLRLLGADDEEGRARVDRESLAFRGDRSGDVGVTGFSMSDHDVTVHLRGDSPTPGRVWRAALDHSTAHAADLLSHLGTAGVPIERLVLAGGWSRMPSVLDARRALAPTVEVAAIQQPGPRGAALYGRWAATQGDPISSDLRPPAAYFTSVAETVSVDHAPPLAKEATS